jgi:hypothetical protein
MSEKRWPLPHQQPERLKSEVEWSGYVGVDNIEGITERVKAIVVPGRTFVIVRTDSGPPRVEAGSTLYINPEAMRKPIGCHMGEHGGGMSVNMAPGIRGFGVSYDSTYVHGEGSHPMTGQEVRDRANAERRERFNWSHFEIHGGLDGPRRGLDLITIRSCNRDWYEEMIQVIPADIPWQLRHERDALTLDAAAELLDDTARGETPDVYHPSHGIEREQAEITRHVMSTMAANLRKWREPLTKDEQFPVFEGMRW